MPIFEYHCKECKKDFEKLVFQNDKESIECPSCGSQKIIKKMSAASSISGQADKCGPAGSSGFS